MTREELIEEIADLVEFTLASTIIDTVQEYRDIMSREEMMKEFFMQCSRVIAEVNSEFEEEEKGEN